MAGHDIVVIGGSAGALKAVQKLCAGLPEGFPAAVFVVLHLAPNAPSTLPGLLSRAGRLSARHAMDSEPIRFGTIVVAPPDHHLLLRPGHVLLRRGPRENRTRPAIDPLFRSAAIAYRSRVIGVVLSGVLDDGAAGLVAVKACGGLSVVQLPEDADWPEMPRNAIRKDHVDHSVAVAELPALLACLVAQPPGPMPPVPNRLLLENRIAAQEPVVTGNTPAVGKPSRLSCPECGGVLNALPGEEEPPRFRCQIGHGYSANTLLAAQNDGLERALESAMRIHRERLALCRRMEEQAQKDALPLATAHWHKRVVASEQAFAAIAEALDTLRIAQDAKAP